jgi:hypothetical protein
MVHKVDMQLLGTGICAVASLTGIFTGIKEIVEKNHSLPPPFDTAHRVAFFLPSAITAAAITSFVTSKIVGKQFYGRHILVIPILAATSYSAASGRLPRLIHEAFLIMLMHRPPGQFRLALGCAGTAYTLLITDIASRILTGGGHYALPLQFGVSLAVGFLYSKIKKPESQIDGFIKCLVDDKVFEKAPGTAAMPAELGFEYPLLKLEIRLFPDVFGRKLGQLFCERRFYIHPQGLTDYDIKRQFSELHFLDSSVIMKIIGAYKNEVKHMKKLHPMVCLEKISTTPELLNNKKHIDVLASLLSFAPNAVIKEVQPGDLPKVVIHNICQWLSPTDIVRLSLTTKWHYHCIASSDGLSMWTAKKLECMRSLFIFNKEAVVLTCPKHLLGRLCEIDSDESLSRGLKLFCRETPPLTLPVLSWLAGDKPNAIFLLRYLREHPELLNDPDMILPSLINIKNVVERFSLPWAALRPLTARMRRAIFDQETGETFDITRKMLKRCRRDFPHAYLPNSGYMPIPVDGPEPWDD